MALLDIPGQEKQTTTDFFDNASRILTRKASGVSYFLNETLILFFFVQVTLKHAEDFKNSDGPEITASMILNGAYFGGDGAWSPRMITCFGKTFFEFGKFVEFRMIFYNCTEFSIVYPNFRSDLF